MSTPQHTCQALSATHQQKEKTSLRRETWLMGALGYTAGVPPPLKSNQQQTRPRLLLLDITRQHTVSIPQHTYQAFSSNQQQKEKKSLCREAWLTEGLGQTKGIPSPFQGGNRQPLTLKRAIGSRPGPPVVDPLARLLLPDLNGVCRTTGRLLAGSLTCCLGSFLLAGGGRCLQHQVQALSVKVSKSRLEWVRVE